MITTVLAFVVVLGVIIFVHEFGHLITAKAFGMRVLVFSFGFGKRLVGFKWGDTDCRVSAIPLGGYVKLEGEPDDLVSPNAPAGDRDPATRVVALADGTAVRVDDPNYFTNRPRWQRFVVYLAGPAMNALLTIAVLSGFYMVGLAVEASRFDRPFVGAVDPGSPAEKVGLSAGDLILSIDGKPMASWDEAQYQIVLRPEKALLLRIRRGNEERELSVRTDATSVERLGSIGAHPLVRIGQVLPGQPAEAAGLRSDDAILAIDGKPVRSFGEIPGIVGSAGARALSFRLWRDGRVFELSITPRDSGAGPKVGIGPKLVVKKFPPLAAVGEALRSTWDMTRQTFDVVGRLLTAQISPRTMMGPLGIAQASGDAARGGPASLLSLVAIISLQVGILNLFPLAPLDGGHLAILAVEGTVRRDLSPVVKGWIMNAGAAVVFLLIGLVLYSDISKMSFVRRMLE
jgi:regulator of sigma E protease